MEASKLSLLLHAFFLCEKESICLTKSLNKKKVHQQSCGNQYHDINISVQWAIFDENYSILMLNEASFRYMYILCTKVHQPMYCLTLCTRTQLHTYYSELMEINVNMLHTSIMEYNID